MSSRSEHLCSESSNSTCFRCETRPTGGTAPGCTLANGFPDNPSSRRADTAFPFRSHAHGQGTRAERNIMRPIAARIFGVVALLFVLATPITSADLFSHVSPAAVLAEEGSPAAGATEAPADPALPPGGDSDRDSGGEATLTPTEPPAPTITEAPVVPVDPAEDPALHTISATIDDPTTCV